MTRMVAPAPQDSGEDRLIAKFFRPLARGPGAFDLTDDAAILAPPPGHDVVLKTDAIVGGVHFFPDDPPDAIGRKALRVNLSDLAAKGARPAGFLLTLALPDGIGDDWLCGFAGGLDRDVTLYDCPLLGGDTVKSPERVMVSIAAFGLVPQGTMVRRNGARPGDQVFVTGTIGDAALGLKLRRDPDAAARHGLDPRAREHLLSRYLVPEPRGALAEILRQHASAAMDVSDGLAGDLAKLCRASGASAELDAEKVPRSDAARIMLAAEPALIETMLTGGDDYEIVCTVPPARVAAFLSAAGRTSVLVTAIGRIVAGDEPPRFTHQGRSLAFVKPSFSHF
jgi:thiamine-monophosphate kinase